MRVRVLGIDPGLGATGIGIVRGEGGRAQSYAYGAIHTAAKSPTPDRLNRIYTRISEIMEEENPHLVVIEDIFSLQRYPKSGLLLGKVMGVILLAACRRNVQAIEVPVREAKQVLTGNGNAAKDQLERAVRHILCIGEKIRPAHASDALALALIGLYRYEPVPGSKRQICAVALGGEMG